jgi:hypothetical protein
MSVPPEDAYALDYATARAAAEERVAEWSYRDDPHGYCHERPVLVALLARIDRLEGGVDECRA